MEWDTAAGHAVLRAAGGEVWSLADGRALAYGKAGFANPHFLAARCPLPPVLAQRLGLDARRCPGERAELSGERVQTR
jgi:hypothetical protein